MVGFIATTDFDWYSYLRDQRDLDEVNFWQPSGGRGFHAIAPGAPFFFKLKSPHYAIGGFGYFARNSVLPDWLAWDSFGRANGAPDLQAMRERIRKYRRRFGGELGDGFLSRVTGRPTSYQGPRTTWIRARASTCGSSAWRERRPDSRRRFEWLLRSEPGMESRSWCSPDWVRARSASPSPTLTGARALSVASTRSRYSTWPISNRTARAENTKSAMACFCALTFTGCSIAVTSR